MSLTGIVKNGMVLLPPGTDLPDGTEVKVETVEAISKTQSTAESFDALVQKLAKPRPHLPEDYALNHGHYRRGEPRK